MKSQGNTTGLSRESRRALVAAGSMLAGSFVLASLCNLLFAVADGIAVIWLSNALAIAVLFRTPAHRWFALLVALFAGTAAALWSAGLPFLFATLHALVCAAQALLATSLLTRFCADGLFYHSMAHWLRFMAFGALLPTLMGACAGALIAEVAGRGTFVTVFQFWYLADLAGICVFVPLVQMLARHRDAGIPLQLGGARTVMVGVATVTVIWLVLLTLPHPFVFVALPLIWAASRLELLPALSVIFIAMLQVLFLFTGGSALLPIQSVGPLGGALDFLPVYAAFVPACIVAVSSTIERRRSQRIIEVESSFRAAMENSRIGMLLVSLNHQIIQANASFCRFSGFSEQELRGRSVRDLLSSPDLPSLTGGGLDVSATGEVAGSAALDREWRFVHKNGEVVWGHWSSNLARGAAGEPLYAVVLVEDIDWRKRSELWLARAEERWKFSLTVTGQGVYDWDLITGATFFSKWLLREIDVDHRLLTSRDDWLARVPPADRASLVEAQQAHFDRREKNIECQYRVRTDAGGYRWIHEVARIMERDDKGQPLRCIGILRDITDAKDMAQSLEDEKEHLQVILTAIADAVVATDTHQNITFMNPVAESLTGWALEDVRGKPVGELLKLTSARSKGEPVPSPIEACLAQCVPIFSSEGAVLHSRGGNTHDVKCSASPLRSGSGLLLGAVLVFQDVTETRQLIRQLSYQALHDDLTGLPNRQAFRQELDSLGASVKDSDDVHVLAYIDLDRFKVINDSAGHQAGDALLKNLAKFLREQLRAGDTVWRLGGDEFGLMLYHCDKELARQRCTQLVRKIAAFRFLWNGRVFDIGASIGITEIRRGNHRLADLMSQVDVACYSAKHAGRGAVVAYEIDSRAIADQHRQIHMASAIRSALDENRLRLFVQPIAHAGDVSHIHHYELLVRMVDNRGNLILPGAFIPAAERYGLMLQVDRWIVKEFLLHRVDEIAASGLSFALNLSADAIGDKGFQQEFLDTLQLSPLAADRLGIEITETSMVNQMSSASQFVTRLRELGCKVALDDFGDGLSSFSYLKAFSVDYIKIDGSFVREVTSNFVDQMIVESINQVAHRLNARTIAEFVEDAATAARLDTIGVDLVQGYHIGRAVPLEQVLLKARKASPGKVQGKAPGRDSRSRVPEH